MKLDQLIRLWILFPTLTLLMNGTPMLWAQTSQPVSSSGTKFMVPKKEVNGKLIGQEDVLIEEVVITDSGRRYRRLDVGVTGTLEGWIVKEGPRSDHFASHPEFVFTQGGNVDRRFHGILRYEASKGTAVTLIYPEAGTEWNRKLFVTVHGSFRAFSDGPLQPWNENSDPAQPWWHISPYEKLMLNKGYALAKTRRNAALGAPGDYSVTSDDGEILQGKNLNIHAGLLLGLIRLTENIMKARLGEKPVRTYWYGHSAGGMNGRLVNYVPGLNLDENGEPIIDGFLNHDTAGGMYIPIVEEDGVDTLFVTEEQRRHFAKTIEIPHLLYTNRSDLRGGIVPQWMSPVMLINQRRSISLLKDKGLGEKMRQYEVRGVSHMPEGYFTEAALLAFLSRIDMDFDVVLLDLSGLMDGLIDLLDHWVEQDIAPPATQSDWLELGDVDGDGVNENEAIALPEIACPLGIYYPYPAGLYPYPTFLAKLIGGMLTGFASFDDQRLEPQDGRGVFVDMNLNRYLDHRESVDQAWHRLGLLKPGEKFSRRKYQACVEAAVDKLKQEKLITERVAARYIQQAAEVDLPG